MGRQENDLKDKLPARTLLVVYSYHHMNTEKVAKVFGKVLGAQIKEPHQTKPEELDDYGLVGFGSGIDSGKHYKELLDFADKLPPAAGRKAFIFSTFGIPAFFSAISDIEATGKSQHLRLREILQSKGYVIVDEFACAGFNTNSFLRYIGGTNKGRPNAGDLKRAEAFAQKLKLNIQGK